MQERQEISQRSFLLLLAILVLLLSLLACSPCGFFTPCPDEDVPLTTVHAISTENAELRTQVAEIVLTEEAQATRISSQEKILSYTATKMFAPFVTPVSSSPTPYRPVLGSVVIEEGSCCIGGVAGETIYAIVEFEAMSPLGTVTEMRVRVGGLQFDEEQMAEATWEPFVPRKTYPINVAINWIGFYVTVQFKDSQGNLSVVYSDDISVEGHPPPSPP